MAEHCEERSQLYSAKRFRRFADDARNEAELVRNVLRRAADGTLRVTAGAERAEGQAQG
jgi:hypothetical protein